MFYMNLMKKEQTLFAKLEGKLIRGTTHQINDYLIPFIEKNQIKTLVCDCSTLKKMDLEGRYALLNVKIKLKKQKGKILLCNMSKPMKEELIGFHFKILNLDQVEV